MMAPPAKESHYPHPQPLPTRGRGAHRVRTALDFALAQVKYRVRTDETAASDTTYCYSENRDGPGRIDRDRLRIVAPCTVRRSASFVRGRHVAQSVRHECAALHRAVDQRASKVGRRALAVRLWRLRGEKLIRRRGT